MERDDRLGHRLRRIRLVGRDQRFAAKNVDAELLRSQPVERRNEGDDVPVAMLPKKLGDVAIAFAGRLKDIRLNLPDQRQPALAVDRATRLAHGPGQCVLLSLRLSDGDRIVEIGRNQVEGDRPFPSVGMRIAALHQNAFRNRLIFADHNVLCGFDRPERNRQAGCAPFQHARTIKARGRLTLDPSRMIAGEVALDDELPHFRAVLGTEIRRLNVLGDLAESVEGVLAHRYVEVVNRALRVRGDRKCLEDALDVLGKRHSQAASRSRA